MQKVKDLEVLTTSGTIYGNTLEVMTSTKPRGILGSVASFLAITPSNLCLAKVGNGISIYISGDFTEDTITTLITTFGSVLCR